MGNLLGFFVIGLVKVRAIATKVIAIIKIAASEFKNENYAFNCQIPMKTCDEDDS